MREPRLLPLLGALAVAAACYPDGPFEPPEPQEATGRWEASIDGSILDLQLIESPDGTIEGVGHIRPRFVTAFGLGTGPIPADHLHPAPAGTARSVALQAEGLVLWPRVSMTFRSFGFEDINFTGRWVGPHSIRGRLWGSGFEGDRAALRRRDVRVDTTTTVVELGANGDTDSGEGT